MEHQNALELLPVGVEVADTRSTLIGDSGNTCKGSTSCANPENTRYSRISARHRQQHQSILIIERRWAQGERKWSAAQERLQSRLKMPQTALFLSGVTGTLDTLRR